MKEIRNYPKQRTCLVFKMYQGSDGLITNVHIKYRIETYLTNHIKKVTESTIALKSLKLCDPLS